MRFKTFAKRFCPLLCFLIVSLPHHPFSSWLDDVFIEPVGFYAVQHLADIASWVLLAMVAAVCVRIAFVHRLFALRHVATLALIVFFMYATDKYLIVNNIERIHFLQYAALALLLGFSLRSEMLIFLVTTFGGFLDEFLQYAMNPMKTNYLDLNDIVLNLLGAAVGVVLLMGLRKPAPKKTDLRERKENAKTIMEGEEPPLGKYFLSFLYSSKSSEPSRYETVFGKVFSISMAVVGVVVLLAGLFGRIVTLVEQANNRAVVAVVNGKLSFILSFERHDKFWLTSAFGKMFHILSAGEGIALIVVLILAMWCTVVWLEGKRIETGT